MAGLHISDAEAVRDPAAMFRHGRAGFEVVVEGEGSAVALVGSRRSETAESEQDHDMWFRSEVQRGLESSSAHDGDEKIAEEHFAKHRRNLLECWAKLSR